MKKTGNAGIVLIAFLLLLVFFILFILRDIAWGNDLKSNRISDKTAELIKETVDEGVKLCDLLEEENIIITNVLIFIAASNHNPVVCAETGRFKKLVKEAKDLILESKKLLKSINPEKDGKELIQKLSRSRVNIEKASKIHEEVFGFFQMIFYPLMEEQRAIKMATPQKGSQIFLFW